MGAYDDIYIHSADIVLGGNYMAELEKMKKDLAKLVIRLGVNIQKGQKLSIACPVECADFARLCAEEAYEAGCGEVIVRWDDDRLARMKYLRASDEVFDTFAPWDAEYFNTMSQEGAAFLSIYSEDPECLSGVDPDRLTRAEKAKGEAIKEFRQRMMRDEVCWCVCSVPTGAWAEKVFPGLSREDAVEKLWEEILKTCRVDGNDALQNWKDHSDEIQKHVEIMNGYDFKTLKYRNSAGTDVTVDLPEGHYWAGGEEKSASGIPFSANIPTEEVFTLPDRNSINGTLVATKPLSLNGTLVENFSFRIENGKIVEVKAEKGEEVLKDAISVDEGASYFGEVALVPYDSPISKSGVLFYNTLFDENASCHFAFGEAYPNIRGAEDMTEEELKERGVNMSMTHVDFMVGSDDLEITGITHDGKEIPVFVNGNFAF